MDERSCEKERTCDAKVSHAQIELFHCFLVRIGPNPSGSVVVVLVVVVVIIEKSQKGVCSL